VVRVKARLLGEREAERARCRWAQAEKGPPGLESLGGQGFGGKRVSKRIRKVKRSQ
jgi:hypothetical protein